MKEERREKSGEGGERGETIKMLLGVTMIVPWIRQTRCSMHTRNDGMQ